jgi:hypothetical protein
VCVAGAVFNHRYRIAKFSLAGITSMSTEQFLEQVAALAGQGVAVIVATRDRQHVPELTRAWGLYVVPGRAEVEVSVATGSGARTFDNLEDNQQAAINVTVLSSYRSLQIKGHLLEIRPASADDRARVAGHQDAFIEEAVQLGLLRSTVVRLFAVESEPDPELMTLRVAVEQQFDQTPGPNAGSRM